MRKPYTLAIGVVAGAVLAAVGFSQRDDSPASTPAALPAATAAAPAGQAGGAIEGKVLETIAVERYVYLRLDVGGPQGTWAAVPTAAIAAGDHAKVVNAALMQGFESKALKRTFDEIYFGTLAGSPSAGAASPHGQGAGAKPGLPGSHPAVPPGKGGEAEKVKVGKVAPAGGPDGRTIAQIHAQAKQLDGKAVQVRGVVVKKVDGVLKRNWIHLRDGGPEGAPDGELVVTTLANVEVGQTVLAAGKVVADKDLGSGYRYDVLVEDAELTPAP
jgi:hypothetical protein